MKAIWSRLLQFTAGPQQQRFYTCSTHVDTLLKGDPDGVGLFLTIKGKSIEVDTGEEECFVCRSENQ